MSNYFHQNLNQSVHPAHACLTHDALTVQNTVKVTCLNHWTKHSKADVGQGLSSDTEHAKRDHKKQWP